MLVQCSPLSIGRFFVTPCSYENKSCAYKGFDYQTHIMQPNLNTTSMGLRKVTPLLPKGNLLPMFLLSLLAYFWATVLERSQKNYFYIRKMSFYFYSPHTGKTILFYQSFQNRFPPVQVECGIALLLFSLLKSKHPRSSHLQL